MTQEEIIAGNKLIALFLYPEYQKEYDEGNVKIENGMFVKACLFSDDIDLLRFHSSWDWLMEACKKWDNLDEFDRTARICEYQPYCDLLDNAVSSYEIEPAFKQLVENITWYNKQK